MILGRINTVTLARDLLTEALLNTTLLRENPVVGEGVAFLSRLGVAADAAGLGRLGVRFGSFPMASLEPSVAADEVNLVDVILLVERLDGGGRLASLAVTQGGGVVFPAAAVMKPSLRDQVALEARVLCRLSPHVTSESFDLWEVYLSQTGEFDPGRSRTKLHHRLLGRGKVGDEGAIVHILGQLTVLACLYEEQDDERIVVVPTPSGPEEVEMHLSDLREAFSPLAEVFHEALRDWLGQDPGESQRRLALEYYASYTALCSVHEDASPLRYGDISLSSLARAAEIAGRLGATPERTEWVDLVYPDLRFHCYHPLGHDWYYDELDRYRKSPDLLVREFQEYLEIAVLCTLWIPFLSGERAALILDYLEKIIRTVLECPDRPSDPCFGARGELLSCLDQLAATNPLLREVLEWCGAILPPALPPHRLGPGEVLVALVKGEVSWENSYRDLDAQERTQFLREFSNTCPGQFRERCRVAMPKLASMALGESEVKHLLGIFHSSFNQSYATLLKAFPQTFRTVAVRSAFADLNDASPGSNAYANYLSGVPTLHGALLEDYLPDLLQPGEGAEPLTDELREAIAQGLTESHLHPNTNYSGRQRFREAARHLLGRLLSLDEGVLSEVFSQKPHPQVLQELLDHADIAVVTMACTRVRRLIATWSVDDYVGSWLSYIDGLRSRPGPLSRPLQALLDHRSDDDLDAG